MASPLEWAYSLIEIKSFDEEQRIVRGIASTPNPDRGDDVVDPFGVKFTNPLPFLLHHDQKTPVGQVYLSPPSAKGIAFEARIPKVSEPGIVQQRTDEAWHSFKYGLLRGASMGFLPHKFDRRVTGGRHLKQIEVMEVSGVTVPMNAETTVLSVKALDAPHLAALGDRSPERLGATGQARSMTFSEQITTTKTELQTKCARLEELNGRDESESGLTGEETKELDVLTLSVKTLTQKVLRLEALEAAQAAQAKGVTLASPIPHTTLTTPRAEVVKKELPKGTLFTRYAMAVAAGRGSISDTLQYAKRWEHETPEVGLYIKAIAGSTSTTSPSWGAALVETQTLTAEFIELLRPATVLGRITGIRRVPPRIAIARQTTGSTVNWVGEQAVKPVTELDFDTVTLGDHKIAGIVVLTEELVRASSPSAEEAVRRDLVEQIARFIDDQLLDPAVSASANNPASLTNGVASPAASGADADALYVDINTALATFDNANNGTASVHIIIPPALARGISTLRNTMGNFEFPALTMGGGTLMGFPVIVSSSVPSGTVVLIKADEILMADEGGVRLDASNQATIDMAGGASPTFSLWQRNCIGIRAERFITWGKRRTESVAVIDTAAYAPS